MKHASIPRDVSPQLDALRGLSALVVMFSHAYEILIGPTWHGAHALDGLIAQAAVMMFFALSGFLICKSITRNASSGHFDARSYAIDRFNRIVPPLAFSMALVIVLWAVAPLVLGTGSRQFPLQPAFSARAGFDMPLSALLGSALFVNGFFTATVPTNAPLWSLSFEVWYYVAAGLLALGGMRWTIAAAVLMAFLGWISREFLLLSAVWFAGAGVAIAHSYGMKLTRIIRPAGLVALVAALLLGYTFLADNAHIVSNREFMMRALPYFKFYIGMFFAALLYEIATGSVRMPTAFHRSAGYSYTLYIIHFPLLLMVYGLVQPLIDGRLLPSCAVALAGAMACWWLTSRIAPWLESRRPFTPVAVRSVPGASA